MARLLVIVITAIALAGCQGYTLVSAERTKVGDGMTVTPEAPWNRSTQGHTELWTKDGPLLQELRFVVGAKEGDKLFPATAFSDPKKELPAFRGNMTPPEIVEFFVASVTQIGVAEVKTRDLRPAKFGPNDGFRFSYSFTNKAGVDHEGFVVATIKDKRLYLLSYRAARVYFFERDRESVERLISSIRFET